MNRTRNTRIRAPRYDGRATYEHIYIYISKLLPGTRSTQQLRSTQQMTTVAHERHITLL